MNCYFEGQLTINQIYKVPCAVYYNIHRRNTRGQEFILDWSLSRGVFSDETSKNTVRLTDFCSYFPRRGCTGTKILCFKLPFLSCNFSPPATFLLESWLSSFVTDSLADSLSWVSCICTNRDDNNSTNSKGCSKD